MRDRRLSQNKCQEQWCTLIINPTGEAEAGRTLYKLMASLVYIVSWEGEACMPCASHLQDGSGERYSWSSLTALAGFPGTHTENRNRESTLAICPQDHPPTHTQKKNKTEKSANKCQVLNRGVHHQLNCGERFKLQCNSMRVSQSQNRLCSFQQIPISNNSTSQFGLQKLQTGASDVVL